MISDGSIAPAQLFSAAEMNHRIANNLALLAALVDLDGRLVSDPAAISVLEATRRRIHAIAGVHRRLYRSQAGDAVDLCAFLGEFSADLRTMCEDVGGNRRLFFDGTAMTVPLEYAVAVGLLVAELVSNACKYAYPGDTRGDIRIIQRAWGLRGWTLIVEDDGVGFTALAAPGLGSQLIHATAKWLGASYEWRDAHPGTRFTMRGEAPGAVPAITIDAAAGRRV